MTPAQSAAFVAAQTEMMRAEGEIMKADNLERSRQDLSPAYGPDQWKEFYDRWENVLGYNAIVALYNHSNSSS